MNLGDYLYLTRKFLRDSQGTFYDDTYLTKCVNLARADVIYAAKSTRSLGLFNLVPAQQAYSFDTVLGAIQAQSINASQVLSILTLTIEYNNPSPAPLVPATSGILTYQLDYLPWSRFSAIYRAFPISIYPTIWSQYGDQQFYVAPIPSQSYVMEADALYLPPDMQTAIDAEAAFVKPWTDLVPLTAAYWAKFYEAAYNEAENFAKQAAQLFGVRIGAKSPWRITSQYGSSMTS